MSEKTSDLPSLKECKGGLKFEVVLAEPTTTKPPPAAVASKASLEQIERKLLEAERRRQEQEQLKRELNMRRQTRVREAQRFKKIQNREISYLPEKRSRPSSSGLRKRPERSRSSSRMEQHLRELDDCMLAQERQLDKLRLKVDTLVDALKTLGVEQKI